MSEENLLYKTAVAAIGSTVELYCNSNDKDHNFMLWLLGSNSNTVIAPGSNYDQTKYKYEILSGKLHINSVSANEAGIYTCISKALNGSGYYAEDVEMIIKDAYLPVKLVAIVLSIIVIISCTVIFYRLYKEEYNNKYDGRVAVPIESPEEDEGDEIYNQTTTSINQPQPGPSRNQSSEHLLYGIDNQGLDTDFNSVFENIQIKYPPQASLI